MTVEIVNGYILGYRNLTDAADYYDVPYPTLYQWVRKGQFREEDLLRIKGTGDRDTVYIKNDAVMPLRNNYHGKPHFEKWDEDDRKWKSTVYNGKEWG